MPEHLSNIEQHYRGERGQVYYTLIVADEFTQQVISRQRCRKIQPYIRPSDRVLEFGVGGGYNLRLLSCREKWGYDLNEAGRCDCEKFGIHFLTNLDRADLGCFDAVLCHHVLEHTADPLAMLDRMKKLLGHNGRLLLYVPHETRRRYRNYRAHDPNQHLFSWNAQSLGNLVAAAGFRIETIKVRPFSYERRLAFLARLSLFLYRAGLFFLRLLRPENEIFLLAGRN